jgi:hypothetical protein
MLSYLKGILYTTLIVVLCTFSGMIYAGDIIGNQDPMETYNEIDYTDLDIASGDLAAGLSAVSIYDCTVDNNFYIGWKTELTGFSEVLTRTGSAGGATDKSPTAGEPTVAYEIHMVETSGTLGTGMPALSGAGTALTFTSEDFTYDRNGTDQTTATETYVFSITITTVATDLMQGIYSDTVSVTTSTGDV